MRSKMGKEKNIALGKLFFEERKKRNLNLRQAVEKLQGITIRREYLWMIENGQRIANQKICDAICDVYGLPRQAQQQEDITSSFMSLAHELRKLPYSTQIRVKQIITGIIELAQTFQ